MAILHHEGLPPSGPDDKNKNTSPQGRVEGIHDDTIGLSEETDQLDPSTSKEQRIIDEPRTAHISALGEVGIKAPLLETPQAEKKGGLRKRTKAIIAGAIGATVAAGAIVFGVTQDNDKEADRLPTDTQSAPASPGPSEATSAPTSEVSKPSVTETTPAFRYTPENPAQIAKIDSLVTLGQTPAESQAGVKQFELLTEKQRSSWNLSILDKVAQGYNPQVIMTTPELDSYTFGGKNLADYNPIKSEMDESGGLQYTRQSTAEENFGLWLLQKNVTSAYTPLDQNSRPTAYNKYYSSILASGEVAAADPQTSKEYRNVVDSAMDSDSVSAMKQDVLDSYTVKQGSELYPVKLGKETYEATTIEYTIHQDNNTADPSDDTIDTYQVVRVFEPMPEELGKDKNGLDCGLYKTLTNKHIKTIPAPSK